MRQYYHAEDYEEARTQCPDCGAYVWDTDKHDDFHTALESAALKADEAFKSTGGIA